MAVCVGFEPTVTHSTDGGLKPLDEQTNLAVEVGFEPTDLSAFSFQD